MNLRRGNKVGASKHGLKEAYQATLEDLRTVHWKGVAKDFLFMSWIGCVLGVFIYIAVLPATANTNLSGCLPDGEFSPFDEDFNWWAKSGFFEITLAVGRTSFSAVKIIDVAWDVIVGRGGQGIIALVSWRVFSEFVAMSMATQPVTYVTFWVIFLQKEGSLSTMYHLIREFIFVRRIGSRAAEWFMIWTMAFILLFPTLTSSMTGYTPAVEAFVTLSTGGMEKFSKGFPVAYRIRDGSRVKLGDNYSVPFTLHDDPVDRLISEEAYKETWSCSDDFYLYENDKDERDIQDQCYVAFLVSRYVNENGFYGLKKKATRWNATTNLESPALDIEAFYIPKFSNFFGHDWGDKDGKLPFQDIGKASYDISGTIYNIKYVKDNGICQPVRNEFQWGFSYIQLFVFMLLFLLWTIGLSVMWLKAHVTIKMNRHPGAFGSWKSLIMLSQALEKDSKRNSLDIHTMTDNQLKHAIRKLLHGGSVESEDRLPKGNCNFYPHFISWLNRAIAWLILLAISSGGIVISWFFYECLLLFFVCSTLSLLLGFMIGPTPNSMRFISIGTWIIIGVPLGIFWAVFWRTNYYY